MTFEQIYEPQTKENIVRKILEALPDWFEMEEGREQYIKESANRYALVLLRILNLLDFCD